MQVFTILPISLHSKFGDGECRDFFILFKTSAGFIIDYISPVFLNKVN